MIASKVSFDYVPLAAILPGPESLTNSIALHRTSAILFLPSNLSLTFNSMSSIAFGHAVSNVLFEEILHTYVTGLRNNLQVASFQFVQTIFDTFALGLILWKTTKESFGQRGQGMPSLGGLRSLIMKHGLIYYVYVFETIRIP